MGIMYNGTYDMVRKKILKYGDVLIGQFKKKSDGLYNFRCPYCGDSQKSQTKARGFMFRKENTMIYKCHNCGKSTSSVHFLKDNFPDIHREYLKEYLQEKGGKPKKHASGHKMPSANSFKFVPRTDILNKNDIMSEENLKILMKPCSEVAVARKYLEDRKIPSEHYSSLYYRVSPNTCTPRR